MQKFDVARLITDDSGLMSTTLRSDTDAANNIVPLL